MTASITVLVQKLDSVIVIPGKALRFTPDAAWLADYMKKNPVGQRQGAGAGGTGQSAGVERQRSSGAEGQVNPGQYQAGTQTGKKPVIIWVKSGELIHRARVVTGASDGTNTEIKSGLKEGDDVILSMSATGKSKSSTTASTTTTNTQSPFMPQRPAGTRR